MLITVILILCLPLVDVGFCGFMKETKWSWKQSCENHPFAISGVATNDTENPKQKGDNCKLIFDYPDGLREGMNTLQLELEDEQFCKRMFPDEYVPKSAKLNKSNMTCVYERKYKCSKEGALVIGDKCVTIHTDDMTYDGAKATCIGGRVISQNDNLIMQYLIRLYQWNKPSALIWGMDSNLNARFVHLGYSAIGDHLPGSSSEAPDLTKKATVVCVAPAKRATATVKALFCDMLKIFLKLQVEKDDKAGTCYWTTVSVMTGKFVDKNHPANMDKAFSVCRARIDNLNYAVIPTTKGQIDMLNKFTATRADGKKRELMLPADWDEKVYDKKKQSMMEYEASRFTYKVAKMVNGVMKPASMAALYTAHTWEKGNPSLTQKYMSRGLLMWNRNGKIQNVEGSRRAPMLCATGPMLPITTYCPNGWEVAHRATESICFQASALAKCPAEWTADIDMRKVGTGISARQDCQ